MAAMALAASAPPPAPAARAMAEAVDLAPPGLRRDRVAVDLEENEVPLGEIAPAFESTVSQMHLLAPAIWL
jgi:hypothetical protein